MEASDKSFVEIWVVRHGQTHENTKNLCQGHTDGTLTELGIKQAQILGQRLKNERFDVCYVSDLGRTKNTYKEIIQQNQHKEAAEVVYSSLLREKGGGVIEGKPLKLIADAAHQTRTPIREYKPEKGESWIDVHHRASEAMNLIFYDSFIAKKDTKKILVVSHGGWIMELLNYIRLKEKNIQPSVKNSSKNCSINILKMKKTSIQTQEVSLKSHKDVNPKCFKIDILVENDDSHFSGTNAGHSKGTEIKKGTQIQAKPIPSSIGTVGKLGVFGAGVSQGARTTGKSNNITKKK